MLTDEFQGIPTSLPSWVFTIAYALIINSFSYNQRLLRKIRSKMSSLNLPISIGLTKQTISLLHVVTKPNKALQALVIYNNNYQLFFRSYLIITVTHTMVACVLNEKEFFLATLVVKIMLNFRKKVAQLIYLAGVWAWRERKRKRDVWDEMATNENNVFSLNTYTAHNERETTIISCCKEYDEERIRRRGEKAKCKRHAHLSSVQFPLRTEKNGN